MIHGVASRRGLCKVWQIKNSGFSLVDGPVVMGPSDQKYCAVGHKDSAKSGVDKIRALVKGKSP